MVAASYAKFRPTYPAEVLAFILGQVPVKQCAWDCATGNGQVAGVLADHFEAVYATDISRQQLDNAVFKDNIFYSVQPAEQTNFSRHQFDLITVGQAIHWFDFGTFYNEVERTLKDKGILAVIGYGPMRTEGELHDIIQHFYTAIVGKYWDAERKYIDELYETIPFPFDEIGCPAFSIKYNWTIDELMGYLSTWSAVGNYLKATGQDPIQIIIDNVRGAYKDVERIQFSFPVLLRIGKKR